MTLCQDCVQLCQDGCRAAPHDRLRLVTPRASPHQTCANIRVLTRFYSCRACGQRWKQCALDSALFVHWIRDASSRASNFPGMMRRRYQAARLINHSQEKSGNEGVALEVKVITFYKWNDRMTGEYDIVGGLLAWPIHPS
ncbi:hypothetical protein D9M72_265080 [compost metagenome]